MLIGITGIIISASMHEKGTWNAVDQLLFRPVLHTYTEYLKIRSSKDEQLRMNV